ncbi:hypothetical protein [Agromyces sp. NPDC058126]|uniref:hypothetical protein n=1 Tax=Agromyces sp. NPDC058126 TaxID=3346350 RepID=UPI0036DEECD4
MATMTGCVVTVPVPDLETPAPTSVPSSAAPSPSTAPTPAVEPIETVVALVARPESLELRDAAGTVVIELDYLDDADAAIAAIEEILDAAPVDEELRGTSHFPPTTVHRWGVLELWENRFVDRWAFAADEERTLSQPSFHVVFRGADVGGVALSTQHGVSAGSPWAVLEAMPDLQVNPSMCSGPYLDYVEQERMRPDGTVYLGRIGVDFGGSPEDGVVTDVRAPTPIFEDGCA